MNNGEDLLVQLIGDEEDCLWVTQPYRVELLPSVSSMTVTTSIMRWIPFESLMDEKVRIAKTNVLTYMMVDDIVADKYLTTISEQAKEERAKARERQKRLAEKFIAIANTSGSFH
jgi:predicted extracellular nuclease